MFELAGNLGIDPGPYTYRELLWMHKGRMKWLWQPVSHILAVLYAVHGVRVRPNECNPYLQHSDNDNAYDAWWRRLQSIRSMPTESARTSALQKLLDQGMTTTYAS